VTGAPSEGEKTAIALCYFLSTLEADDRKIKDLIVVIDDPVSSLDTKAMNYACSLVRNRLSGAAQLIVLTHNQHCMNEFKKHWKGWAKGEPDKVKARLKFIDVIVPASTMLRTANIIDLPVHLREYESEYHYLFEKVLRFEEAAEGHFDYAFMMPNVLRRVLEIFLAFKVPRSGNISDKLKTLCERHKDLDLDRLNALERLTQVESHSDNLDDLITQSAMTVEESRDANTALLHLMKTVDGDHHSDLEKYCKA
jgi:wobble nucleotide-excising tRNase